MAPLCSLPAQETNIIGEPINLSPSSLKFQPASVIMLWRLTATQMSENGRDEFG